MEFLPLFPLNLVVFPGEKLRLYIFEPRYRQLVNECIEEKKTFGIPPVIDQKLGTIATEMEVISVDKKFEGGEMNVTTRGLRRARIDHYYHESPGKMYPGGEISWLPQEEEAAPPALQAEIFELVIKLHDALGITNKKMDSVEDVHAYALAHDLGLNLSQEFKLLSLDNELSRLSFIKSHLEKVIPVVNETERLKARAKLNGHYKQLLPPDF
ncbi:MAG: LON peptidase substrate-binding domain-containing protein [Bacteroidota bacterium]